MTVTDEQVQQLASTARPCSVAILSWGPERHREGADAIEREHQRRMVTLRADGTILVLLPVPSGTVSGVAVLGLPADEAREVMAGDPCVQAGMITVEVHGCLGFPGDAIPG